MKILHIISSIGKTQGGTSEVVPRLCEALSSLGNDVRLMTCEFGEWSDAAKRAACSGVEVKEYALSGVLGELIRYSRSFDNDVSANVAWADVVHLHGLWQWPCWRAGRECRQQKKPYFVQPHGFLEPERLKISSLKKKIAGVFVERNQINRSAAMVATAESEKIGILQYGVKRPVEIVPIGFDTDKIAAAGKSTELLRSLGVPDGAKVILYFSRITPIKGLDMLAAAWAQLNEFHGNWHLLVVGPDDRGYTDVVRAQFKKLMPSTSGASSSYTIHGPVYGNDKYSLLKSVDLFVLPTRSENFSIAVQESLAAGVPVVCTKGAPWGGLEGGPHWGKCGWWVEISVGGIRDGLRCAMTNNHAHGLSIEGVKYIEHEFNWHNIALKQIAIYKRYSAGGTCV